MVLIASKETGLPVIHQTFQEMAFNQFFDGVWAQASLLHVPYQETRKVYKKTYQALKPGGIFYASYKYGQDYMSTLERDFWHMDEERVKPYFKGLFEIIKIWKMLDTRLPAANPFEQAWLNFIVKKKTI